MKTKKQLYMQEYYQKNKDNWNPNQTRERKNEVMRKYVERNKDDINRRRNKWVEDHFEWNLWSQSKRRAKYAGIHWNLQREDIVIPEKCAYLGIPLTTVQGQGQVMTNASIDRIDNTKGYTKDNIQIISRLANSLKRDASIEQLLTFAENVIKLHGNQ